MIRNRFNNFFPHRLQVFCLGSGRSFEYLAEASNFGVWRWRSDATVFSRRRLQHFAAGIGLKPEWLRELEQTCLGTPSDVAYYATLQLNQAEKHRGTGAAGQRV